MINAVIDAGDLVLMRKQERATEGKIVKKLKKQDVTQKNVIFIKSI